MFRFVVLNIFLAILIVSCKVEDSVNEPAPPPFIKTGEFQTNVPEPSGLTLDLNPNFLWTVSDNTNQIYKIDTQGNILKTLPYTGDDLEGIVFDKRDNTLWAAEEQLRQLVHIDTNGAEIERFQIQGLEGDGNSGIEGVCLNDANNFFVLNEKEPPLWAQLDSSFTAIHKASIDAVEDLSGITTYDNKFLIVSDQSQKMFVWEPGKGIILEYFLNFPKAEGIAYNDANNIAYVISDKTEKLYVFKRTK